MARAELTGRERMNRMMARRDHDRVPRYDLFWTETLERWRGEGFSGDDQTARDLLGADAQELCWASPAPFPGRREVLGGDDRTEVVRNDYGAVLRSWRQRTGTPEHLGFGCDSRHAWEQEYKPAALASGLQLDLAALRARYRRGRAAGRWCFLAGIEGFEVMKRLMGDEITLLAMAADPDWIRDVSATFTDLLLRDFAAVVASGVEPDGLFLSGDMGCVHGTLFSPQHYRELIRPDHERIVAWCRRAGIKVWFHTDGNVNAVLDQYVEVGFDALHPLEVAAHMELSELAPRWGDRLSFIGGVDKRELGSNHQERAEAEVLRRLTVGMERSGYAYHSDHSVPPEVSWATYQLVIELLDRHGRYD